MSFCDLAKKTCCLSSIAVCLLCYWSYSYKLYTNSNREDNYEISLQYMWLLAACVTLEVDQNVGKYSAHSSLDRNTEFGSWKPLPIYVHVYDQHSFQLLRVIPKACICQLAVERPWSVQVMWQGKVSRITWRVSVQYKQSIEQILYNHEFAMHDQCTGKCLVQAGQKEIILLSRDIPIWATSYNCMLHKRTCKLRPRSPITCFRFQMVKKQLDFSEVCSVKRWTVITTDSLLFRWVNKSGREHDNLFLILSQLSSTLSYHLGN